MPFYIDQLKRKIFLDEIPKRIISLVPSQTELLADLGLDEQVVGITKFCVHPQCWFRTKKRVGGTKEVKMEEIEKLRPDLIIANKEENSKEQILRLSKSYPVWISDVSDLNDALLMIAEIGKITGKSTESSNMIADIKTNFLKLDKQSNKERNAAYFIWRKPYLVAGGGTFISNMIEKAGFRNAFDSVERYPETSLEDLNQLKVEYLLLSSEPFPFKPRHFEEFRAQLPEVKIILVDGEYFSWYGSRLVKAPEYFLQLYQSINE